MPQRLHSGFATFPDTASRDAFVSRVLSSDPALHTHAYIPATRPVIVFDNLEQEQQQRLLTALNGLGRWMEDVQFSPME
jgi:hypothetical protein